MILNNLSLYECKQMVHNVDKFIMQKYYCVNNFIQQGTCFKNKGAILHKIVANYFELNIGDNKLHKYAFKVNQNIILPIELQIIMDNFLLLQYKFNQNIKTYVNVNGTLIIDDVRIAIKIDRINITNNEIMLIDYKTGTIESEASIIRGENISIGLQIALLLYGTVNDININRLMQISVIFWKLSCNQSIKILKSTPKHIANIAIDTIKKKIAYVKNYSNECDLKDFYK